MKNKKKFSLFGIIIFLLSLVFAVTVGIHTFFNKSMINVNLSSKLFFAQFYAFPILFGMFFAILSFIILSKMIISRSKKNLIFISWSIVVISSIIFMIFCREDDKAQAFKNEETIKIVEWNALNNISEEAINKIFVEFDADIAVFPELNPDITENSMLEKAFSNNFIDINEYDVFSSSGYGSIAPTTIIAKKDLVKEEEMRVSVQFGALKVKNLKFEIVGLHTAPPIPTLMTLWKLDLETIFSKISKENPKAILIGDFNATLRHGKMNLLENYTDVLSTNSIFERGTWPQKLPKFLRASIDHVLLPKDKYSVKSAEVVDLKGSDHAAIFTEIGIIK